MTNKYPNPKPFNLYRRIHGGNCIHKKQFPSEAQANQHAEKGGWDQRGYKCKICPCWHLTTNKNTKVAT